MAIQPPAPEPSTLTALANYQGTYHNHKEELGYAAAALYLGGAVVVCFGLAPWSAFPSWAKGLFLLLLAITGVAGLFYVFWQFHLRSVAADGIRGLLRMLPEEPEELRRVMEPRGWFHQWAAPGVALLVMFLWGVAAFVRVVVGL
jgi:hypothetical protein